MTITVLKKATKAELRDLNELVKQLRGERFERGTLRELRNIVSDKSVSMIVAKDNQRIVGVATLYEIAKIGKRNAHIEDVVVHHDFRGRGIGEKLMRTLIRLAKRKRIHSLHLTSRPIRKAANKLYQKLGFTLKKTNPYVIRL